MQFSTRLLFAGLLGLAACAPQDDDVRPVATTNPSPVAGARTASTAFPETFESGVKTSYAVGSATLGTGSWTLDDALLGTSTADAKTGAQSVRVRNVGVVGMNFDLTTGAGTVSVAHAVYGADAASQWELCLSTNGGGTYAKVGATVSTSSTSLQTTSFTVNQSGPVRLQIRKTSGGTARINLDDVHVTAYGSGSGGSGTGGTKFLFDATHAEMAGNADWVLDVNSGVASRYPTPAQSGITSTTSETYWTGAVSAWGVALVKLGNTVETLPVGSSISYGNAANPQDLANYSVFVVDEPNKLFTNAEKTAILQFVQNGGGLLMIADHTNSDRDNDGWDSPRIWNDLMTTNAVQVNPFGFSIALTNISETSSNVRAGANPILNGSQGVVSNLKFSNGATITTTSSAAQNLIWRSSSSQGTTNGLCASSTFGTGRVFLITDSSPADDGTGSPGNTLYRGWTELASHARLHLNASLWLAKQQ